jgi:hypothetical protein
MGIKIVFTNHAKYRLNERGISVLDVRKAIREPDSKKSEQYDMIVIKKRFGRKVLEVVCKLKRNECLVITAYYEN